MEEEKKVHSQFQFKKIQSYFIAAVLGMLIAWGLDLAFQGNGNSREPAAAPLKPAAPPLRLDPKIPDLSPSEGPEEKIAEKSEPSPGKGPPEKETAGEPPAILAGSKPPAPGFLDTPPPGEKLQFREIWSYLMLGEERLWSEAAPITDLALFDLSIDPTGHLSKKVNTQAIERARREGIRTHLTIASSGNQSLFHLILNPSYPVRKELISEIARLPHEHLVDGIQLDFEGLRRDARTDLVSFIQELRAALPTHIILSLALPAKVSDADGPYVYADLAGLADRFFIMVYDQHWRGGSPGAISDLHWHNRVLACVRAHLPVEKVVVGLPFYGRVWQKEIVARALKYPGVRELALKTGVEISRDPARSHTFTYKTEVTAECWFEDVASLKAKLESAKTLGFSNVGFWRLGQEDPLVWEILEREQQF